MNKNSVIEFSLREPFTAKIAQQYQGKKVRIKVSDSGLQAVYEGILEPLDQNTTQIGNETILNECVVWLREQ